MSFFISDAMAQGAAAPQGGGLQSLIFLAVLFAVFYFLLIRPQQKRQKEHQALIGGLEKGDEVVTSGGVVGQVTKVEQDFVVCRVGDKVELRFQRQAVIATLPKGTLKTLDSGKD